MVLNTRESTLFDFSDLGVKPGDVISLFAGPSNRARSQPGTQRDGQPDGDQRGDYNDFLREQNDISDIEGNTPSCWISFMT